MYYPILTDLLCSPGTFTCGSQCLSLLKFCDGFQDCLDGSDEPLGCSIWNILHKHCVEIWKWFLILPSTLGVGLSNEH